MRHGKIAVTCLSGFLSTCFVYYMQSVKRVKYNKRFSGRMDQGKYNSVTIASCAEKRERFILIKRCRLNLKLFSLCLMMKKEKRQVSSMILSARPTVSPVAIIVFTSFCFARF